MRAFVFLAFALVAACARPLTPSEMGFADAMFGETLDTAPIRVRAGAGLTPLPRPQKPEATDQAAVDRPRAAPPEICVRTPSTDRTWRWPAAFVLYNQVFFSHKFYLPDTFEGWPDAVPFPQALVMAHELVHVWQWQNRARTHYRPAVSAQESVEHVDPYWWVAEDGRAFLSYGYEQQAAMIEDYVCYQLFDPHDPKVDELRAIISPVLPLDRFDAVLER